MHAQSTPQLLSGRFTHLRHIGNSRESSLMRCVMMSVFSALPLSFAQNGTADAQELESFAIVAGSTLTNTGPTTIVGNIALSPGTSYTGSASVTQTGSAFVADAVADLAQQRVVTLYNFLGTSSAAATDLTGQDLAGQTLTAGTYRFDSSALLTGGGTLTLDAQGDPEAIFIIDIGSTLTAGPNSRVVLANGAQGGNVFYRVGSSATLDTTADLAGQIVAMSDITLNTGASINCGAAFARTGAVTLDTNVIRICTLAGVGFAGSVDDPALSDSERAVAVALSDYVAGGGILPVEFAILAATQSPAELAVSLAQLSAPVAGGVAPMSVQAMDAFLDTVMRSGRAASASEVAQMDGIPIGQVPDRSNEAVTGKYGNGKYEAGERLAEEQRLTFADRMAEQSSSSRGVWAAAFGSRLTIQGDAERGNQQWTSDNSGIAAGLNYALGANTDIGAALSWNEATFALGNGFGSGTGDTIFVALRARSSTDRGYLEGALAYGRSDITTERRLTIAGIDRLAGETGADTFAGHVEAGYHMGRFTSFAGLRAASTTVDAYAETAREGAESYALQYEENTTRSLRSEIGVAMNWPADPAAQASTSFGLRAAWAHELASNDVGAATFIGVPGLSIPVSGATRNKDSLLLAANAEWVAGNGLHVDGAINAEYSGNSQDVGGSLTVGYRW